MDPLSITASSIAIVTLATQVTKVCGQYFSDAKGTEKDIKYLQDQIERLKIIAEQTLELVESPGSLKLNTSKRLQVALEGSKAQLEDLDKDLAISGDSRMSRLRISLKWPYKSKDVEKFVQRLHQRGQEVSAALNVDQTQIILSMDQKAVLEMLPLAKGAAFDSHDDEAEASCLPDTRVELLAKIRQWASDPNGKTVFWLRGMAGTGKSTISRTTAQRFWDTGNLGASFFFKRGKGDRARASKFITTLTRQLVHHDPKLAPYVKDALESHSDLSSTNMRTQFDKLIAEPWERIQRTERKGTAIVIVIDALDECEENEERIGSMIHLLSRLPSFESPRLRFFVTSRPESSIRLAFTTIEGIYQHVALHDEPPEVTEKDIFTFLRHELSNIRERHTKLKPRVPMPADWPGEPALQDLTKKATPLFIFAATACRFIGQSKYQSPVKCLEKILKYRGTGTDPLKETYLPILDQLLDDQSPEEETELVELFRQVVGTIVLLESPLSTNSLAELLETVFPHISADGIDMLLESLHSVLRVPSCCELPIQLLHLSFRDFLVDPKKNGNHILGIDETQGHEYLAEACRLIMEANLREDMCQLKWPGTLRSEVDQQTIDACFKPEIQYACRYWVHHTTKSKGENIDALEIFDFLAKHLLHWLEALSLMGRGLEGSSMIRQLQALQLQSSQQLMAFLDDSLRFIIAHMSMVDMTPLQLYSSALAFSPTRSIVRETFANCVPKWISMLPQQEDNWDPCLLRLEHLVDVKVVAFSHDSKLIAVASDEIVRIWSSLEGTCLWHFKGHTTEVISLSVSPNSKLVASGDIAGVIRIWSLELGLLLQELRACGDRIDSLDFSHDSTLMLSVSGNETVRIWRTGRQEHLKALQGHVSTVESAYFSHDSRFIVSAHVDGTVRLWEVETGTCVRDLKGHAPWSLKSAIFSHDSALIASYGEKVLIWNSKSGDCIKTMYCAALSVAFSHDSIFLAIAMGLDSTTVQVLNWKTGEVAFNIDYFKHHVTSVAFSHDSRLLATACSETVHVWSFDASNQHHSRKHQKYPHVYRVEFSPDSTILTARSLHNSVPFWSTHSGEWQQELKFPSSTNIDTMALSHDAKLIAIAAAQKLQIWDREHGECVQELSGHLGVIKKVKFSHDSSLIATCSLDDIVRVWTRFHKKEYKLLHELTNCAWVSSFTFSHDSTLLTFRSHETMCILDLHTGVHLKALDGSKSISSAFSPDGSLIATTRYGHHLCGSRTLHILKWRTGEVVKEIDALYKRETILSWTEQSRIQTSVGLMDLYGDVMPRSPPRGLGLVTGSSLSWVTWNDKGVFRLPAEFNDAEIVISPSTSGIALCSFSGAVILIRFDPIELERLNIAG